MVEGIPKILAIIPARGGSKGVAKKNIQHLKGIPLIHWSIDVALKSPSITHAVVSTEDDEIAAIAESCGLPVPFKRPPELAEDDTPTLPVVQYVLKAMEAMHQMTYHAVLILEPTSPLRNVSDVENAVKKLVETQADSVISLVKVSHAHPIQVKIIVDDRIVPFHIDEPEGIRRQDLKPDAYVRNGAIYLTKRDVIVSGSIRGELSSPLIMPPERSLNIDSHMDFLLAEFLLNQDRITRA